MPASDEFLSLAHGVLHKLPPGPEAQVNVQAVLLEHFTRVTELAGSKDDRTTRRAKVVACRTALIRDLEELCDTEHGDGQVQPAQASAEDGQVQPAQASAEKEGV